MLYGDEDYRLVEHFFNRDTADRVSPEKLAELAAHIRGETLRQAESRRRHRESAGTRSGPWKPPR